MMCYNKNCPEFDDYQTTPYDCDICCKHFKDKYNRVSKEKIIEECKFIVDNECSIRYCAENFEVDEKTIRNHIKLLYNRYSDDIDLLELYYLTKIQIRKNIENYRFK